MFETLKKKFASLFSKDKIDPDSVNSDIILQLVESDVSVDTAEAISGMIRKKIGKKTSQNDLNNAVRDTLREILSKQAVDILHVNKKPYVILFLGINGSGKTSTIIKMANYLKGKGKSVVISASDTFRAGAIDQVSMMGREIGVEVIKHDKGSDPSAVAFDSIDHARARNIDYVLIDTAGRMNTNKNLLDEMKKIKKVSKPDLSVLVIDAVSGQDALIQARAFLESVSFDAVIVTKLDTDAKGGSVLSIYHDTGKPVIFACTGQGFGDIMPFDPEWYISKVLPE